MVPATVLSLVPSPTLASSIDSLIKSLMSVSPIYVGLADSHISPVLK